MGLDCILCDRSEFVYHPIAGDAPDAVGIHPEEGIRMPPCIPAETSLQLFGDGAAEAPAVRWSQVAQNRSSGKDR
jgi:hypothetical protein